MKERYQVTDLRKEQNRLTFGAEGEDKYGDTEIGLGRLSKNLNSGKIKIAVK